MRVSILNIRSGHTQSPGLPLGIAYLAGVLDRDGHTIQLIDPLVKSCEEVIEEILRFEPDLVGISTMTLNFNMAIRTSRLLRKHLSTLSKKVFFCAGGLHPTVMPEDALRKLGVDFVVIGEGEKTISVVCRSIERSGDYLDLENINGIGFFDSNANFVRRTHQIVNDLDSLPMPAFKLLDMELYLRPPGFIRGMIFNRVASVISSRGCPFPCTYCSSSAMFKKRTRFHSKEYIVRLLRYLKENYDIDAFYFTDETFALNKNWTRDLCQELPKVGLPWGCSTRVDLLDWDLLKIMKEAGCVHIDFGVESGSQEVRDTLRRGQDRRIFDDTFAMCKKLNIRQFAQVMVGCPGESKEQVDETINMLKALKPTYTMVSIFTPLPGTTVFDTYRAKIGPIDKYLARLYDFDIANTDYPLVNLSNMLNAEIIEGRSRILRAMLRYNYSSMLTKKHFFFFLKCFGASFFNLHRILIAFKKAILERRVEYIVYAFIFNYVSYYRRKRRSPHEGWRSLRAAIRFLKYLLNRNRSR